MIGAPEFTLDSRSTAGAPSIAESESDVNRGLMAVWWWTDGHREHTRAIIYLPKKKATAETMQATLTHCAQRDYTIVAVAHDRDGWTAARRLLNRRAVDVVVTVPGGPDGEGVEIAPEVGQL